MATASEITRKAKSNLAFALGILPKDRRDDMVVFYAFCRVVDDIADDAAIPLAERQAALSEWRHGLEHEFERPNDFQKEVVELRDRRQLPTDLLVAIIEGCRMDLKPQRFETWDDLSQYTWKVACAVGLVSIRIFGCKDPLSEKYAVALGHALQLTNILRDVGEDLANGGRIYLPLADLARFDYTERELTDRVYDDRFLALMRYEAERAEAFYREAAASLTDLDRSALVPAQIMGEIYHAVLAKMRADGYKVFHKRYRISGARKLAILSKRLLSRGPTAC